MQNAQPRPDHEPLFQIYVDENHPRWGRREIAVGPKMCKAFLGPIMEMIGKRIASGAEKASAQPWSNPRLVQVTVAEEDSPFTREDRANDLVAGHRYVKPSASSLILH